MKIRENSYKLLTLTFLCLITFPSFSEETKIDELNKLESAFSEEINNQDNSNTINLKGENLDDAKFIIKKDKKANIYDIDRYYFPFPKLEIPPKANIYYSDNFIKPTIKPLNHQIRVLKAKQLQLSNYYDRLFCVGAAFDNTFNKPACEIKLIFGVKKNERYYMTNHAEIFFPDFKNQIYFNHSSGKYVDDILLSLDLNYERKIFKRREDKDLEEDLKAILGKRQALNNFNIFGNLDGKYNDIEYQFDIGYDLFKTNSDNDIVNDAGKILEHQVIFDSSYIYKFEQYDLNLEGNLNVSILKPKIGYQKENSNKITEEDQQNRNLINIGSKGNYNIKKLDISGGFNIYTHNDKDSNKTTLFSPLLEIEYNLNKIFNPYMKLNGGEIEKNTYSTIMHKNPLWKVYKNAEIKHIYKPFTASFGFNSNLPLNMSFNANLDLAKYSNFVSFQKTKKQYELIYIKDILILNPNTELNVKNNSDTFSLNFKYDFFKYLKSKDFAETKIDYEPNHKINILGTYKIQEKLFLRGNLFFSTGATIKDKKLDDIIDAGIGLSYTIVDNLLLNIDCENIFWKLNEKYEGVPGRNFMLSLGLGYRW
ncbi:MAG: TonB-dependent receptor [Bacteroidetes bacterium]|nr:TonB-dependent receptor [Bacteroidota bacterium]